MIRREGLYAIVSGDRCVGVGQCMLVAPDAFDFGETGLSEYLDGDHDAATLREAADSCPSSAITVYRDGTEL